MEGVPNRPGPWRPQIPQRRDPQEAEAWGKRGNAGGGTVDGRDYDEEQCYLRALELDPKHAPAWNGLGNQGGGTVDGRDYDVTQCFEQVYEHGGCAAEIPVEDGSWW